MDTSQKYLQPEYLRKITIFSSLDDADLEIIINAPENGIEEYESKDVIFHEEEIGNCMYIILEGSVDVFIKGSLDYRDATIATLREGDYFGESAVLTGGEIRRNASVRAELPSKVFRIDKKHILNAINRVPGNTEINARFPPDEARDKIMEMPMFNSLNYDELLNIKDWTSIETFEENEFIFRQGELAGHMYIIIEGFVEMLSLNNEGKFVFFETRKPVDYIGVTPLLPGQDEKYKFSVKACSETRVIKIPKDFFKILLNRDKKLAKNLKDIYIVKKMKLDKIMQDASRDK
jgi:CRP-like cAMP-binding protein